MPERDVYDVAVLGGGSAGVAAALAAADLGARTLLVEGCAELGGNVAQAWVHTICGLYHAVSDPQQAQPLLAHEGLGRTLPEELLRRGAARPPERAGKVWVLPLAPRAYSDHLSGLVAMQPEIDCRRQTQVVGLRLASAPDHVNEIELVRDGARQQVAAQIVVDTSGDGVSGQLGGAASERAAPELLQRPSFIFQLRGVADQALEGFGRLRVSTALAGAERSGVLPAGCESVLARPGAAAGEAFITINLPVLEGMDFAPQSESYRQRMEERGRHFAESITAYLCDQHEAFRDASIAGFPNRLGVREGSRIQGLCVIEEEDILKGRRSEDEVALSTWPIELWNDHRRAHMRYPSGPTSIPLGALVSRSHPKLAMAGRCLSASHAALGALRVIGTALATGDAAGRAAALAVGSGRSLSQLKANEVRAAIRGS